ncbi:MAG: T9SS type A sorting domain-containing protein [Saprospiraceae bacterium]|nr:T9SS type A sorting domain-containing protein [Saprospiraceae bacterium]
MKKILLVFLPIFVANLAFGQWVDTVRIQTTGLDGGVEVSTDDAEQKNNEIDKLYDDDLDIGWEGDEFNVVSTGLRYRGVNVPKGATIDSAFIEIWAHEDEGDLAIVTIYAEASDNPVTYNETDLISDRPRTTANVVWNCDEEWTIWEQYRTPDLKALVQEVVDRDGWQQGNAMAFYLTGQDQGASDDDNARDFEGFENVADPEDGGDGLHHPERISKLVIYFSGISPVKERSVVANMKVTPNPAAGGYMRVALDAFQGEDVSLKLTDLSGRTVRTWKWENLREVSLKLDLDAMPGIYALEVVSANKVGVAKVVVQ